MTYEEVFIVAITAILFTLAVTKIVANIKESKRHKKEVIDEYEKQTGNKRH